jgi:plasmid stability protein
MGINITIKDLPEGIGNILREQAKLNHRSLNAQIKFILEQSLTQKQENRDALLDKIRLNRAKMPYLNISNDELNVWKNEGRE